MCPIPLLFFFTDFWKEHKELSTADSILGFSLPNACFNPLGGFVGLIKND